MKQQQQHHANILSTTFQSQSQRICFSVKKRISHFQKEKCRCHELAVARLGNSEMDQELLPFSIWYFKNLKIFTNLCVKKIISLRLGHLLSWAVQELCWVARRHFTIHLWRRLSAILFLVPLSLNFLRQMRRKLYQGKIIRKGQLYPLLIQTRLRYYFRAKIH